MICSQCGSELAEGATSCARCGAARSPASTATGVEDPLGAPPTVDAGKPPSSPPPNRPSRSLPPFRFDAHRLTQTDRISGIASAALFITLFLPWFGVRFGVATYSATVTADGLSSHGYLYVVLIGTLALLGYLTARAGWGELALNRTVAHRQLMALVTGVDLVLVLLGFLFRPGGSGVGWEYGAFLGLIAAIVAAVPGLIPALLARGARN